MRNLTRFFIGQLLYTASSTALLFTTAALSGQTPESAAAETGENPAPLNWTTQQDHGNMLQQLGITRLRPGPSGQPGATNSANYDPAKANPFPDLPDVLRLKNGQKVTPSEMWWTQRRPEIVEDFEREVVGRVPKNVPKVIWSLLTNISDELLGNLPASGKRLVGHVDNSGCPSNQRGHPHDVGDTSQDPRSCAGAHAVWRIRR